MGLKKRMAEVAAAPGTRELKAIIRDAVSPSIRKQFEESQSLYSRFSEPSHPWLQPEGMASYIRIMRGEEKLPHLPNACEECRRIFRAQLVILKEHDMYASCGPGKRHKRNPGRVKIARRVQRVRERLAELTQRKQRIAA